LIFSQTGYVANDLYVAGFAWSPVYLLTGKEPVLFEAGFHCMGRVYEHAIREVLGDRSPERLFLTHVHWDHCGSTGYLKKVFPDLPIAASQRAVEILKRPNAVKLMAELSDDLALLVEAKMGDIYGEMLLREPFESFHVDMALTDGQEISLKGGITVRVVSSPGHTRDMLSFYIPEKKILIATETIGNLSHSGRIISEFLVDYDGYLASVRRLSELDVEVLCQGHHFVFVGEDVKKFFTRSLAEAEAFGERVEQLLDANGGSVERVMELVKADEYDSNTGIKQTEAAYLLNLRTRVTHLAERLTTRRMLHKLQ
jgi:2-aminobenzoylacetyl-CoA thioesterase